MVLHPASCDVVHQHLFVCDALNEDMPVGHAYTDVFCSNLADTIRAATIRDKKGYNGGVASDGQRIGVVSAPRTPVVKMVAI